MEGGGNPWPEGVAVQVCHWMTHSITRLSPVSRMRICSAAGSGLRAPQPCDFVLGSSSCAGPT